MISIAAWTTAIVAGGVIFLTDVEAPVGRVTIDGRRVETVTLTSPTDFLDPVPPPRTTLVPVPVDLAAGEHQLRVGLPGPDWRHTVVVVSASDVPRARGAYCDYMEGAFATFETAWNAGSGHVYPTPPAMLVWNAQGSRVILVEGRYYPIYRTMPIVVRAVLADGTIGPPWRLERCDRKGTELSSTDARYRLWNKDGSARSVVDERTEQ